MNQFIELRITDPISLPEDLAPPRPLTTRSVTGEVNPDGIPAVQRWGKFDGSASELGPTLTSNSSRQVPPTAEASSLPGALESGARLELALKNPLPDTGAFLRVRGAYVASNAGLKIECAGKTYWNELFEYTDAGGGGNFSPDLAGIPSEFTRCVYLPAGGAKSLVISNPGKETLYFDAIQLESHAAPGQRYVIGAMLVDLGNSGEKLPAELSREWGLVRSNMRTQYAGPPGDPDRFKQQDLLWSRFKKSEAPIHILFEGTPEWAAISADRYAAAKAANRPHTTVPGTDKYLDLAKAMLDRYGKDAKVYEIWNEIDIATFWRGSPEEYATFFKAMAALIRKKVPDATVVSAGLAGFRENTIDVLATQGVFQTADWVAFHPYAGQSGAWDIAFGQMQGKLYSLGIEKPIYCDESGFTWKPDEWYKGNWSPETQKQMLDVAMSRLFSDGVTKFTVFHASAGDHAFDLIDKTGVPRPAYAVFRDYLQLGLKEGRHIDVSITGDGGSPLQGTGVAAAQHADGTVTTILNPAQSPLASRAVTLRLPAKVTSASAHDESGPIAVSLTDNEIHLLLQSRTVLKLTP